MTASRINDVYYLCNLFYSRKRSEGQREIISIYCNIVLKANNHIDLLNMDRVRNSMYFGKYWIKSTTNLLSSIPTYIPSVKISS